MLAVDTIKLAAGEDDLLFIFGLRPQFSDGPLRV